MAKVEIDLSKEIEKEIEKEVLKQLNNGGLLRFIRNTISNEVARNGLRKQVQRHESILGAKARKVEK